MSADKFLTLLKTKYKASDLFHMFGKERTIELPDLGQVTMKLDTVPYDDIYDCDAIFILYFPLYNKWIKIINQGDCYWFNRHLPLTQTFGSYINSGPPKIIV